MFTLKDLCKFVGCKDMLLVEAEVKSLQTNSRLCDAHSVFVPIKGVHVNGLDYLKNAQEQGALAALVSKDNQPTAEQLAGVSMPIIYMPHHASFYAKVATWLCEEPSHKLRLIGITGTNGKSTITSLISQWLSLITGAKAGLLGTLGYGFLPHLHKSANTTLDAISLQQVLGDMVKEGATYAAMEVSSIGVCEGRISGCEFAAGGFTNLTRDHLDYHKTMENYAKAKKAFLDLVPPERLVINIDDETGAKFASDYDNCIVVSRKLKADDPKFSRFKRYVIATDVVYKQDGLHIKFDTFMGKGEADFKLMGTFNIENILVALGVLLSFNAPLESLLAKASQLVPVKGRVECFNAEGKPHLVVDYAHTPDGVEQVLKAVRAHHPEGEIWCVLGCGGDRDKGKRAIMAIKACVHADKVVFTSDNPRTEDPERIIDDMVAGVQSAHNYKRIADRTAAIKFAFEHASANDCIVIAGKGHEDYQIFKDKTIDYSDRKLAASLVGVSCD
jgi:UDP-N-acetylmuramoyl-L-alanyl-D-glutamate--2,6-diaminopimelate ligase